MHELKAVLFDMDGVITATAKAHAAAWKRLFDEFLKARAERHGGKFRPFDSRLDYRRYVDGKPRMDGVKSFLDARGIELPCGDKDDDPDRETVCGLGNRKDRYFNTWLEENQVYACPGTLGLIQALRAAGDQGRRCSPPAATPRRYCATPASLEPVRRQGSTADDAAGATVLPGKPDPAMLLEAARRLGVGARIAPPSSRTRSPASTAGPERRFRPRGRGCPRRLRR
ncbi:MAG: hypothetical protein U5K56_00115 [Halioglobus sp.]|nr:hypothetical protein [Halioglobus sp.]